MESINTGGQQGGTHPPPNRPPSKDRRSYDCEDCGTPTVRKRTAGEPLICLECGINRGIRGGIEMHNRSGPAYDKFREAMRRPGQARPTKG